MNAAEHGDAAGAERGDAGAVDREEVDPATDPRFELAATNPRLVERLIAASLVVALGSFAALGVAYWRDWSRGTQWFGMLLAIGCAAMGAAMIMWGKYLMPKGPFAEDRHPLTSTEADRAAFADAFVGRGQVAMRRRGFLGKLLGAVSAVFGVVLAFPLLRSLGPNPGDQLDHTKWTKGSRLVTIDGRPISVNDNMEVGGWLTVYPEGWEHDEAAQATSMTLLIRASYHDVVTVKGRKGWAPQGYVAYSKVCTHAGCPITLYQRDYQQLLCPCHQSLFNILSGAQPIFGPAPRPLPQLPLYVDPDGHLRAQGDYSEPIGPGYWERP